jgi:hypothetical protein
MRLVHEIGRSIALHAGGSDAPVWRYVYDTAKPKPFFHPVCTPRGHVLTNFEPHDHLWHRGLWFTFKFINKENFWEERPPFGMQRTAGAPGINHEPEGAINLFSRVDWVRPDGQTVVIREQRQMTHRPLDDDAYAIDFYTTLVAQADLEIDRTPYTRWGGYGGLILRGTRNWQKTRVLLSDGTETERPTGPRAAWADLSGKLDGGPEQTGGFAIFDHPSNLRHPTPWYGGAEEFQNYVNAALLFHEPMQLASGASLSLRYRVLVHDGIWDAARLQSAWDAYAAAPAGE